MMTELIIALLAHMPENRIIQGGLNTTVNLDRIFNWGESIYPDLFSDHPESLDIFGYYARIYSNGNAIGEQNGDLYFYDGGLNGTGDIILIGTIADFFPQAISAGF